MKINDIFDLNVADNRNELEPSPLCARAFLKPTKTQNPIRSNSCELFFSNGHDHNLCQSYYACHPLTYS